MPCPRTAVDPRRLFQGQEPVSVRNFRRRQCIEVTGESDAGSVRGRQRLRAEEMGSVATGQASEESRRCGRLSGTDFRRIREDGGHEQFDAALQVLESRWCL